MKTNVKRFISLLWCFVLTSVTASVCVSADTQSNLQNDINSLRKQAQQIQNEINSLKSNTKDKAAILAAVQKKVANTQAQINRCNQEIASINSKISANKAEINKKNAEIEADKLEFKKRLRAIYMSNSDSSVKILLGAESFSDYLQLSKLTSAVSSRDKAIMEDIVSAIDVLNKKNEENEKLLESQVSIRKTIEAQQQELKKDEAEAQSYYNEAYAEQKSSEKELTDVNALIKAKQRELDSYARSAGGGSFINPNTGLMWPVPYTRNVTSGYGARWGTIHRGIDISSGGIYGKPIVAIADGVVESTYNSCPHQSKESRCSCGSGWGNHVKMDHGVYKGSVMRAVYAHMSSVAVSPGQRVKQGQVIGYVGTTGDSTGYHLHLSIIINGSYVDPAPYFFG
ncbi:MAG: peptidoglycan DD-metalloendopeptidase family protein [Clostridia bacterium]|nr:peptidoglycan DD-metalloendopeptidase family protein [Clostridia bacterium]